MFAVVIDRLTERATQESLMFADDTVICSDRREPGEALEKR